MVDRDGQVVKFSIMGIKLKRRLKAIHLMDFFPLVDWFNGGLGGPGGRP